MPTIELEHADLADLVRQALAGDDVVIAEAGQPRVRLVPIAPPPQRRELGRFAHRGTVSDDYDAPLPENLLRAFEGG